MMGVNIKYICLLIVIFTTILVLSVYVDAQTINELSNLNKEKLKKADEYYELLKFHRALELYLEIFDKAAEDTAIICRIANSYKMLNNHVKAEEWYRKAVTDNETTINPRYKFYLANELTANGKYDEALYWFKEYYQSEANDKRALASIESLENLSTLYFDTTFYVINPVKINTKYAEFCPVFYKDDVVFLTDRDNSLSGYITWDICRKDSSGNLVDPVKFENHIKPRYNAGPFTFFDDYEKVIFSQNYTSDKLQKKEINEIPLQLFSSDVGDDDSWTNAKLLPFIEKDYSYTQPTVSDDGKTLYFSSDIPGGFGGADLYKSEFKNGTWGEPQNLGAKINTMGNEMFPFIFNDTVLFFASDGHGGLGGLDIMKINMTSREKLEQIGTPINSSADDFGIILSKDGLSGYFSSNRSDSLGNDDIYRFQVIRVTFTIKIVDENTALPVSNAEIYTLDEKQVGTTDENGSCTIIVPASQVFELKIKKDNYESKVYTIEPFTSTQQTFKVIPVSLKQPDVTYKVQIWASRKPATKRALKRKYKGNLNIDHFYEDKWYKYSIGEFNSYSEAIKELINCNVYDAFIIAYVDNKKVHITVAKKASNESDITSPIFRRDLHLPVEKKN